VRDGRGSSRRRRRREIGMIGIQIGRTRRVEELREFRTGCWLVGISERCVVG